MNIYKPKEFANKINVSVNTLQRWDREGTLIADRNPKNRRFYTDSHYEYYLNNLNKSAKENDSIKINIRLKKESSIFVVEIQNIKTKDYIQMYRDTSYENCINTINKNIKDFSMIGIDVNITNDIE